MLPLLVVLLLVGLLYADALSYAAYRRPALQPSLTVALSGAAVLVAHHGDRRSPMPPGGPRRLPCLQQPCLGRT
ncbi:hypothetical protein [Streptomyces sp. CA-250714]|uniref:hypothetical protein n=1 Tax=Streptomyces sp. CA-250714 TaxID=3240060 RepID=UPI003D8C39C1